MPTRLTTFAGCLLVSSAALAQTGKDCNQSSIGLTPINDLQSGLYMGASGGLYPGGSNTAPTPHHLAGIDLGRSIIPLNPNGQPSPQGRIVLLTIGMSNTSLESGSLIQQYDLFLNRSPFVSIVNGAQGGQDAQTIANPSAQYWNNVDARLAQQGLTRHQVQAVWLKQAVADPDKAFPADAMELEGYLHDIVRILHDRFPNLKQCYLSSRIYAGYALGTLNPEPFAYQSAFSVKWLIQKQIDGTPSLNFDPLNGPTHAPWLSWGAYLWADGLSPRSDGLIWRCDDFANDGTHPSPSGSDKVATLLLHRFAADPTSRPWFVACEADLNNDGSLNLFDMLAFVARFNAQDPLADCDNSGSFDLFDFLCFTNAFNAGCP